MQSRSVRLIFLKSASICVNLRTIPLKTMSRALSVLFAILTLLLTGCAHFDDQMAGSAVDIPDDQPVHPVFSATPPPAADAPGQSIPAN